MELISTNSRTQLRNALRSLYCSWVMNSIMQLMEVRISDRVMKDDIIITESNWHA